MWVLVALGLGMMIGWQFPQPAIAKSIWTWVESKIIS